MTNFQQDPITHNKLLSTIKKSLSKPQHDGVGHEQHHRKMLITTF
jgi:hypothetical protein